MAYLAENFVFNRHAIACRYVLDTFEVLGAPESDEDGVILAICCDFPRVLNVELQPDTTVVVAQDVPIEVDHSPRVESAGRNRNLKGI